MDAEYLAKRLSEYDELARILGDALAVIGDGWSVINRRNENPEDAPPWYVDAVQAGTGYGLRIKHQSGKPGRVEIYANNWPSYKAAEGRTEIITPSAIGETAPSLTAASDKPAKALAVQIKRSILAGLPHVYGKCKRVADSRLEYANKHAEAVARLKAATGDHDRNCRYMYIQNMPGCVSVSLESSDSVKIDSVSLDEAIKIIALLRECRGAQ